MAIRATPSATIPDVLILEPQVHRDARGTFVESFNQRDFDAAVGARADGSPWQFVQDNHSRSVRGVLRGLHAQLARPQGKLVRVAQGRVWDVAVDIRPGSASYGKWAGVELSGENFRQLWIPPGLAHGFLVLSDSADLLYKTTYYYDPASELCLRWDDPALAIAWPDAGVPVILSEKDRAGLMLAETLR